VAGHLLNDNLGGPGTACNLTPLTTAGNGNHLDGCETRIKNTIDSCFGRTQYYPTDPCWYGVYYRVEVDSHPSLKWGATHPFDKVAISFKVWAHCVQMNKKTGAITAGTAANTPADCWFDAIAGLVIDNAGYT
jgi:hypothetical protein